MTVNTVLTTCGIPDGTRPSEQAGLQRAEAAKVLQVLRTKEQPRDEQAGRDEHQKGAAGRDRTARQQVQAHQGSRYGALDEHEHPVQDAAAPLGRSAPRSVQPSSPALSMP